MPVLDVPFKCSKCETIDGSAPREIRAVQVNKLDQDDIFTVYCDREHEVQVPAYAVKYAKNHNVQKGQVVTIKTPFMTVSGIVVSVEHYDSAGWYIELTSANVPGRYAMWKQRDDGGDIVSVKDKCLTCNRATDSSGLVQCLDCMSQ